MPDSKFIQSASEASPLERFAGRSVVGPTDAFWRRVEQMLAEIAALTKAEPLPADFPTRVLMRLHEVLLTSAGIFWKVDLSGRFRQACKLPDQEIVPSSVGGTLVPACQSAWTKVHPTGLGTAADMRDTLSESETISQAALSGNQPAENQTGCLENFDEEAHRQLLASVVETGLARSVPAELMRDARTMHLAPALQNSTLLLCPVKTEGGSAAVLELIHDQSAAVDEQLSLEVLRSVAELCADYLRRCQLRDLTGERLDRERLVQFTCRIHDSLDLAETAYTIANEGRRLIDCDRVTVLACRGPRCETLAVSGAARWDRRSNTIVRLEQLAGVVAAGRAPLVFCGAAATLPPQVRSRLEAYLEAVQVRSVIVVPLIPQTARHNETNRTDDNAASASAPAGVLIVEQFSGVLSEEQRQLAALVCQPSTQALEHALQVQRIPWARFFRERDWRRDVRRGRAALVVTACLALLLLAACLVPADLVIEARGVLQPRNRRDVFAPDDGIVDRLSVDYGTSVSAGQPLVVLRNAQLDLDLKRVWGELQAARKRLSAIESARVEGAAASATSPVASRRLSGEDAELQELVASLARQHRLLQEHQTELSVASPIAGQVLTWDLPQLLQGRPVHRGQVLMTVADPNGPWLIELDVPDRDAGHVIEARQNSGPDALQVTFLVATDPGTPREAVIDKVAMSIERSKSGEPALRAIVDVDRGVLPNSRPGATIIAKIHCGRRSLAYVWLHDLYYAIATRLLF